MNVNINIRIKFLDSLCKFLSIFFMDILSVIEADQFRIFINKLGEHVLDSLFNRLTD